MTSLRCGSINPWCLLVPLGATEQHGPHLPVETDTLIAEAWAEAAASRFAGVVVAPPLPYGSSGEHQTFPGTISIGREALAAVLVEIVRSATVQIEVVVFVSGHGGNIPTLAPVTTQLRHEGHQVDWIAPQWPGEPQIDAHAGHTETSLMLHLQPDKVQPFEDVTGNTRPLSELMPLLETDGLAAVTDTGVLGHPSGATARHGERLFADLVQQLVDRLTRIQAAK